MLRGSRYRGWSAIKFGGSEGGIFKSTDGGSTWKQLSEGLPAVLQANLAVAPGNSKVLYATVAGTGPNAAPSGGGRGGRGGGGGGSVGLYKSTDAGEHWALVTRTQDPRPLARIGETLADQR